MLARMTEVKSVPSDQSTRRDRLRARTREEIVAAAQTLVADGEELSMRAVARAVGMTAPALYRYVRDHDDLVDQVGGELYEQLIAELTSARDGVDSDDLCGRLVAMAHCFREWALTHRNEYGLLFANPLTAALQQGTTSCTHRGGQRFGQAFAEVFAQMWQRGELAVPHADDIDPTLLAMLEGGADDGIGLPLPVRYVFVRQWARLYGMVTLEAFGHLAWALEDSRALFEEMLADNLAEISRDHPTGSAQQQAPEPA
jgi:AcrR family transcriptional regulator